MILKTIPGRVLFCHSQVVEKDQEWRMIRSGESLTCCWLCNLSCSLLLGSWSRLVPQDPCSHGGGEIRTVWKFLTILSLYLSCKSCSMNVPWGFVPLAHMRFCPVHLTTSLLPPSSNPPTWWWPGYIRGDSWGLGRGCRRVLTPCLGVQGSVTLNSK